MKQAKWKDRKLVADILVSAFRDNQGVNWMLRKGKHREAARHRLALFAFVKCWLANGVLISDNEKGVALFHRGDRQPFSFVVSVFRLWFALTSIPIAKLGEVSWRESIRESYRPVDGHYIYFWFLAVLKDGEGAGFELKNAVFEQSKKLDLPIYLETSVKRNQEVYERLGFNTFHAWHDMQRDIHFWFMKWTPAAESSKVQSAETQMEDLFERIDRDMGPLGKYASIAEGYYIFPELKGPIGNRMVFRGKEVICWSINNYLGLADHHEVRLVDAKSAKEWGLAYPMGARLMTGETEAHRKLERELAMFVQKPSACILNFGYQGMISIIDALLSRKDVVIYDAESHACILDGVRMHLGKRFSFQHNNMAHLEEQLERATVMASETGGGILVISEGVFGMRGDQGRLKEIVALKKKYRFRLLVDDAHGFGTMGENGAGTGVVQGVQQEIDLYFATFAKSLALTGGVVAGNEKVIRYLKYNMRSQVYAKSLPMVMVMGALARLDLIRRHPDFRERLWKNVDALQSGLREAGFDIGVTQSPVTPVYLKGSPEEASELVHDLREQHGVFCSMVIYPIIPKGEIILRLIPTASHGRKDIEETLAAFRKVSTKLHDGAYRKEVFNPALTGAAV